MSVSINFRSAAIAKWSKYKSHINRKELTRVALAALHVACSSMPRRMSLDVLLADDKEMQGYNFKFRGKDRPTNVLSFPTFEGHKSNRWFYMGDIVLSFTTIAKEVENLSATGSDKDVLFYQYVYYLFVHGFLHLLGYTHDTKKPREHMEMLETAALNKLGIDARRFR